MKIFNKCLNHKVDFDNISMNSCDSSITSICKCCGEEISVPVLYTNIHNPYGVNNFSINYKSGTDKPDARKEIVYSNRLMSNSEMEKLKNEKNDWYDNHIREYEDGRKSKLSEYYIAI